MECSATPRLLNARGLGEMATWDGVTQQVLRSAELVVRGAGNGELDPVAVRRERFHDGDLSQWHRRRW